jgi:hypothetical protein
MVRYIECANCGQSIMVNERDEPLQYITRPADGRDPKSFLIMANGGGRAWLAHRCEIRPRYAGSTLAVRNRRTSTARELGVVASVGYGSHTRCSHGKTIAYMVDRPAGGAAVPLGCCTNPHTSLPH